ncbi:serine protease family [Plasmopara halstedii]|uniref:Serine protease family n=1 Tax=Plasmopara halstedii TaxID=4781 RepID=A0A0N7L6U2_PLAHL|nr:serine protease family [Plasmopara halstedii]CEG45227.1 serine protease family [Plasmopara halstedii]|eukprot:XP_024581596.1 serine protease family [Plasmopara halstedii]
MLRTTLFGPTTPLRRATARGFANTKFSSRLTNGIQPVMRSSLLSKQQTLVKQQVRNQYYYRSSIRRESRAVSGDVVVIGLISVNVAVTIAWMRAHVPAPIHRAQQLRSFQPSMRTMLTHFTTSTQHLQDGRYYTLLTAMFSQATLGHLGANMLGLYFFGRQICDVLGHRKFLGLYLASGVLSSAAAVYQQHLSGRLTYNLGASGAVNAITAMSILLFPHGTLLIFGIVPMPAWLGGSLFIFKDAYSFLTDRQDGIGHVAHLSGAAIGGAYYYYLRRQRFRRF